MAESLGNTYVYLDEIAAMGKVSESSIRRELKNPNKATPTMKRYRKRLIGRRDEWQEYFASELEDVA